MPLDSPDGTSGRPSASKPVPMERRAQPIADFGAAGSRWRAIHACDASHSNAAPASDTPNTHDRWPQPQGGAAARMDSGCSGTTARVRRQYDLHTDHSPAYTTDGMGAARRAACVVGWQRSSGLRGEGAAESSAVCISPASASVGVAAARTRRSSRCARDGRRPHAPRRLARAVRSARPLPKLRVSEAPAITRRAHWTMRQQHSSTDRTQHNRVPSTHLAVARAESGALAQRISTATEYRTRHGL